MTKKDKDETYMINQQLVRFQLKNHLFNVTFTEASFLSSFFSFKYYFSLVCLVIFRFFKFLYAWKYLKSSTPKLVHSRTLKLPRNSLKTATENMFLTQDVFFSPTVQKMY